MGLLLGLISVMVSQCMGGRPRRGSRPGNGRSEESSQCSTSIGLVPRLTWAWFLGPQLQLQK